jgi:hypothetical protein
MNPFSNDRHSPVAPFPNQPPSTYCDRMVEVLRTRHQRILVVPTGKVFLQVSLNGGSAEDNMSQNTGTPRNPSMRRYVGITLLSWLVIMGFDLVQNAGVFARFWREPGSAFLPPEKLYQRIPLGYLSFLVSATMLTWLISRLTIVGWKQGALFGLKLGGFLSISLVLGLACEFPIKPSLLLAWFFDTWTQSIAAAAVIGGGLSSDRPGRLSLMVVGVVILMAIATIVMQNLGFAPAMQYR